MKSKTAQNSRKLKAIKSLKCSVELQIWFTFNAFFLRFTEEKPKCRGIFFKSLEKLNSHVHERSFGRKILFWLNVCHYDNFRCRDWTSTWFFCIDLWHIMCWRKSDERDMNSCKVFLIFCNCEYFQCLKRHFRCTTPALYVIIKVTARHKHKFGPTFENQSSLSLLKKPENLFTKLS